MNQTSYYYLNGSLKMGPFTLEALKQVPIQPSTLVWYKALPDWVEARTLPELQGWFVATANQQSFVRPGQSGNYTHTGNSYTTGGNPYAYSPYLLPPMPESNLIWAILTTLFCCMPLGIVSIVYASKVSSLYALGDYEGARKASQKAQKWATWSALVIFVAGILALFLYFLIVVVILGVINATN